MIKTFIISCFSSLMILSAESLSTNFDKDVKALLDTYCYRCHGERKQKGEVRIDILDPDMVKGKDAEKETEESKGKED